MNSLKKMLAVMLSLVLVLTTVISPVPTAHAAENENQSIILNVKSTNKQRLFYVISMSTLTLLSLHVIPEPSNIIVNYVFLLVLVKNIFKLNLLKSSVAFIISTFVFGLLNVMLQNPYLTIFNISLAAWI